MVKSLVVPLALGGLFALILAPIQGRIGGIVGRHAGLTPVLLTLGTLVVVVIPFALIAAQAVTSINDFLARDTEEIVDAIQSFSSTRLAWLADHLHLRADAVRQHVSTLLQRTGLFLA